MRLVQGRESHDQEKALALTIAQTTKSTGLPHHNFIKAKTMVLDLFHSVTGSGIFNPLFDAAQKAILQRGAKF